MQRIGLLLLLVALVVACTSDDDLESEAAMALRTCMEQNGVAPVSQIAFDITDDRRLVDWNVTYPSQGSADADNVHNACIRTIVADLELVANLP